MLALPIVIGFQNCSPSFKSSNSGGSSTTTSAADSVEYFSKTLYPILRQNCADCHGVSQRPKFAVADAQSALNTIKSFELVNLNDPSQSRFVQKIEAGHNGFSQTIATSIAEAVQRWADGSSLVDDDTEAPVVSILTPTANSTINGLYTVQVETNDNIGVTDVTLRVDGNIKDHPGSTLSSLKLDTTTLGDGPHELQVTALDGAGNDGLSSKVTVNVDNSSPLDTSPPTVSFSSPSNGATVSGNVTFTANAQDNVGVTSVEFYLDGGTPMGTDTTAPFTVSWNSSQVVNGQHKVQAWAYDAAGNFAVSQMRNVNVTGGKVINNPNAKFSWILSEVLSKRCTSCHGANQASSGIRLHDYANTMTTVAAPNPYVSELYTAVAPGGSMPRNGSKLTATQVQAISDWIQLGAPNN